MTGPDGLRVEHLVDPLGLTERAPRLSWRLPGGAREQVAYRVRGETGGRAWDTGRVASDRSLFVPYGGPPLASRQRVTWAVKVWTDAGESPWSPQASWETGLLDAADWEASWIRPAEPGGVPPAGSRPAYHLAGETVVERPVARARVYATAHGVYELFVNGARVGDADLAPGFTAYATRTQVQAHDVTALAGPGRVVLTAVLSDGWYRGRTSFHRLPDGFGDRTAFLAQLHLDHDDGTTTVFGTGPDWRSATGPITAADLFDGQETDLRAEPADWSPVVAEHRPTLLVSSPAPPVRPLEELRPVAVTRPAPGRTIVDFGQNLNGRVRLSALGPRGTSLLLTHAEALTPSGDVDTSSAETALPWYEAPRGPQGDRVISAGRPGEAFEPRHTRHGFRYLRVDGPEIGPGDVTAVVLGSDLPRTGWFRCSDDRVNQLYEIAFWTFRNQQCDVPQTEITRECAGWTDWGFNLPAARLLHDVSGLTVKWLRDLASDQWPDGTVRNYAPDPLGPRSLTARFAIPHGQAGWGDAAVAVPWELWRGYGDERVLAEQFASMTAWVDRVAREARDRRHPSRAAARPQPAPHEEFLWDTGYHFGEHLEPGKGNADTGDPALTVGPDLDAFMKEAVERAQEKDPAVFATAYFYRSADLLARIAGVLGRDADAVKYRALADRVRAAWQAEFTGPDGVPLDDAQATHVRALAFGLVSEEARERAARRLVELIRAAGNHPGTGLPATPLLLPVLAATGHADVAYDLLLQETSPSWLTVIERGGTTFWEEWDGIAADGSTHQSLSLPTRATLVEFLHAHVAGIRPVGPGYRRFLVAPQPGGGLTWADARFDAPYGRIRSAWRIEDGAFSLTVTVPPGTTAEIVLPDGRRAEAAAGTHAFGPGSRP
ncbi:family 78 glycoside hydrolase catalytic domain [Actinomadura rugatobispora]|uniref:alpha-L-rhamnosidase n=1 Tax=Actinomadura rugatobispora TaxID=1994 RepID=A0ABW1A2L2_9ACTN|nr:glycoside hydrolase family 78 protein [Actinomadura rugatobispora]